jgi:hypothetical protein
MLHEGLLEFISNTAFYAYLIVFAIGLLWVVVGLLLGGLTSMAELAHDVAVEVGGQGEPWGHQQVGLSPLSPLMLAIFGMMFGITGMTLTVFSPLGRGWVLLATLLVSVVLDGLVYWGLHAFFVRSQSSSLASVGEAVGSWATVATRVAPGMTGTVNYEVAGRRTLASARSADDRPHEPGDVVKIVSMEGGIARVVKQDK